MADCSQIAQSVITRQMCGQMTPARFVSSVLTRKSATPQEKSSLETREYLASIALIATLANLFLLTLNAVVTCNTNARIGDERQGLP